MEFFIKLLAHSSKLPFGGDRKHKYCVMPFACFGGSAKPRHPKQHACFLTKTTVPSEPGWWTITSPLAPSFSRTGLPGAGLGPRLRSDDVRGPPPPPPPASAERGAGASTRACCSVRRQTARTKGDRKRFTGRGASYPIQRTLALE